MIFMASQHLICSPPCTFRQYMSMLYKLSVSVFVICGPLKGDTAMKAWHACVKLECEVPNLCPRYRFERLRGTHARQRLDARAESRNLSKRYPEHKLVSKKWFLQRKDIHFSVHKWINANVSTKRQHWFWIGQGPGKPGFSINHIVIGALSNLYPSSNGGMVASYPPSRGQHQRFFGLEAGPAVSYCQG